MPWSDVNVRKHGCCHKKYLHALKDCEDVISAQPENATAWTVRAEILIVLDKAEEAQSELMQIRKTWGSDNPTIEEGYRRVYFELCVLKAEEALNDFVHTLEQGLGHIRPVNRRDSEGGGFGRRGSEGGGAGVRDDRRYSDESGVSRSSPPESPRTATSRGGGATLQQQYLAAPTSRNTQKSIKSPIGNCRCDGEQRYWEHQHRHQ